MGQAGSTQRAEFFRRPSSAFDHQVQDERPDLVSGPSSTQTGPMAGERTDVTENPIASITNHSHPQSLSSTSVSMTTFDPTTMPLPDGQEEVPMGGLTTQHSADTRQSGHPSTGRQSAMSRLRSRIIPDSIRRSFHGHGDERSVEGASNHATVLPRPSSRQDNLLPQSPSLRNVGSRGITRRRLIRGPYALPRGESALLPDSPPNPAFLDTETPSSRRRFSWRRHSRLSHVRNSIASPMSHLFGQPSPPVSSQASTTPPRRPSRAGLMEDSDDVLPPLRNMDMPMDLDEPHELDSVEPAARHVRSNSSSSMRYVPPLPEVRRSTGAMRSRATRLLRRDDPPQTPLSHILHLAASALAAQISGNTTPTAPNINNVGNEGLDGPLESLLQGLQQIASQEEAGTSDNPTEGGLPNVNFLRVFRFVNPENGQGGPAQAATSSQPQEDARSPMETDDQAMNEDNPERRLLTLVVVGVRSIPATSTTTRTENGANARLNVESLLRLPFLSAGNLLRNERGSGGFLRRGDGRPRFSNTRNSVAGHPISSSYDSQRHQRSHASSRRQSDAGSLADLSSSLTTVLSESPPGPNPPPSTPADPGLSVASSVVNTPSRRPSSASAFLPQLNEDSSGEAEATADQGPNFSFPRQRRRSDSEAARHRGLGSGAARRNGVVEPDDASPNTTRSWLIYVVGANLAENHPALAAPSLFTDNPTYEDMMLLSSLLGPVKPPVASDEEVASAGGLYRLVRHDDLLVAEHHEMEERIPVSDNDRCLICLGDYEVEAEVRLLEKCKHMYHRECIDEWLTTGRNSCPLCRGEGVSSSSNNNGNPLGPEVNAL